MAQGVACVFAIRLKDQFSPGTYNVIDLITLSIHKWLQPFKTDYELQIEIIVCRNNMENHCPEYNN